MNIEKKNTKKIANSIKIIKIIFGIIALLLAILLVVKLFPLMVNLSTAEGQLKFKAAVTGTKAFATLLMLQLIQVILVVLPGEPLEILAGMYYGSINGLLFSLFACTLSTIIIYLLTKKIGRPFIYGFFKKKKVDKVLNSKLFMNEKKITNLMLILFLLPGTPKDLLTYIGALLPINPVNFFLIAILGRIPSIISSTMAGVSLLNGNIYLTITIYVITTILSLLFIWYNSNKDKKMTQEIIDTLKDEK